MSSYQMNSGTGPAQTMGPSSEPSYMDLSNMPVDNKQQQTMIWQQNQYMSDSGIHSGQTTQVFNLQLDFWKINLNSLKSLSNWFQYDRVLRNNIETK